ncbi:MAG: hypothetical protein JW712_13435 [Dehalococcoidales bacterium]|nr:hypothetical protein [Dehalococcoidales bacterium]
MIVKIECPSCQTEGSMSFADVRYEGPYKCWKCKELFTIVIQDDRLVSCEPLSQEEFEAQMARQREEQERAQEELRKQQELEDLKNRFRK